MKIPPAYIGVTGIPHSTLNNTVYPQSQVFENIPGAVHPGIPDTNPFRYAGEYTDLETNTIYLRNRNYSPTTGRFLTEDPAQAGLNWYTYCGNNPILFIDPSGLRYEGSEPLKIGIGNDTNPNAYSMSPESYDITRMQLQLQKLGYLGNIPAYGYFGQMTQDAIVSFNYNYGMGNSKKIVDDMTWEALGLNFQEVYYTALTERERMIIATVAGEAYQAGSPAYNAVAQIILNRFDASPNSSTQDILKSSQFNAIGKDVYNDVLSYLSNRSTINPEYEDIINTVMYTINGEWGMPLKVQHFFTAQIRKDRIGNPIG